MRVSASDQSGRPFGGDKGAAENVNKWMVAAAWHGVTPGTRRMTVWLEPRVTPERAVCFVGQPRFGAAMVMAGQRRGPYAATVGRQVGWPKGLSRPLRRCGLEVIRAIESQSGPRGRGGDGDGVER